MIISYSNDYLQLWNWLVVRTEKEFWCLICSGSQTKLEEMEVLLNNKRFLISNIYWNRIQEIGICIYSSDNSRWILGNLQVFEFQIVLISWYSFNSINIINDYSLSFRMFDLFNWIFWTFRSNTPSGDFNLVIHISPVGRH
jgi:hypothetical protein